MLEMWTCIIGGLLGWEYRSGAICTEEIVKGLEMVEITKGDG